MKTVLMYLVGAAMLATLGVLLAGLVALPRGVSGETSNRLMRYRILAQAVALALFALLLLLYRS